MNAEQRINAMRDFAATLVITCSLAYLIAIPVGLFMLYRIPTQCPSMEVRQ